eukprot:CAMPEP_0168616762 /NCGR_PEP_ID=MMETSP0449_2-20121227/5193_1 /TAXON_ID=1082188 /ORGANISM="Strombidium rassoulzadegani, Strain ras09" /LENGTH=52 /DNA_ID=CAMNT_0008657555 /DNA_START=229 /DNA_END=387 /DNA_ORIENTATION=+
MRELELGDERHDREGEAEEEGLDREGYQLRKALIDISAKAEVEPGHLCQPVE